MQLILGLTLQDTISTFTTLEKGSFKNNLGKGGNDGNKHFLLVQKCVFVCQAKFNYLSHIL